MWTMYTSINKYLYASSTKYPHRNNNKVIVFGSSTEYPHGNNNKIIVVAISDIKVWLRCTDELI